MKAKNGENTYFRISQLPEELMISFGYFFDWHALHQKDFPNNKVYQIVRELFISVLYGLSLRRMLWKVARKKNYTEATHYSDFCSRNGFYVSKISARQPDTIVQIRWTEPKLIKWMDIDKKNIKKGDAPYTDFYNLEITEYTEHSESIEDVLGKKLRKNYSSDNVNIVCYTEQDINDLELENIFKFIEENNERQFSVGIVRKITEKDYKIHNASYRLHYPNFNDMGIDIEKEKNRGVSDFIVDKGQPYKSYTEKEFDAPAMILPY